MPRKALADGNLRALDMPRREEDVRGAPGQGDGLPCRINHIAVRTVVPANTPYVAQVVSQGRQREVQPIFGSHLAPYALASQDILTDQCDKGGMLGGMIERIARADTLKNEPGCLGDDLRATWLATAQGATVGGCQFLAQGAEPAPQLDSAWLRLL